MARRARYESRIELLQGTLDLIILQTLRWGPRHGYAITQAIASHSADILQVDTGSLYPALHRLARQGWLRAEWETSTHNHRAAVYLLSATGRKQLVAQRSPLEHPSGSLARVLHTPPVG